MSKQKKGVSFVESLQSESSSITSKGSQGNTSSVSSKNISVESNNSRKDREKNSSTYSSQPYTNITTTGSVSFATILAQKKTRITHVEIILKQTEKSSVGIACGTI